MLIRQTGKGNKTMNKTDDQLKFIIQDCQEAISAMPLGHKTEEYLALARQAIAELSKRERLRSWRRDLAMLTDPYAYKAQFKTRKLPSITKWSVNQSTNAMYSIGSLKLVNL